MNLLRCLATLIVASLIGGCTTVPGNPLLVGLDYDSDPKGEPRIVRGVVNGLYKYDPDQVQASMAKYDKHFTPEQRKEYSGRYVVRVGVRRAPPGEFLSPVALGKWLQYVLLPEGWTHDAFAVSADPKVINVGDVIDVSALKGQRFDFLSGLVRQCDAPPVPDEKKEWNIGCKTYPGFDSRGFAGDEHVLRSF